MIERSLRAAAPEPFRAFVAHRRGRHRLILVEEIRRIESAGNYARVYVDGDSYLVRSTMQALEERLAPRGFVRVHRTALVPVDQMLEVTGVPNRHKLVLRDGSTVKVSREFWQRLRDQPGVLFSQSSSHASGGRAPAERPRPVASRPHQADTRAI